MRRLAIVLVIIFAIVTLVNVYTNTSTVFPVGDSGALKTSSTVSSDS
ncbi:hypothetical protein WKV44_08485 [Spirochaetia bacterium 38H-sp]|uniref:Uncharacterized protein n=1 Tax=Rarispira pelagica TaxID=3141764 RepID=A0ABU9UD31_9SPIR